jgi:hypothetical protein
MVLLSGLRQAAGCVGASDTWLQVPRDVHRRARLACRGSTPLGELREHRCWEEHARSDASPAWLDVTSWRAARSCRAMQMVETTARSGRCARW